jgi:ADP-ribosylglycohydrolase
MQSDELERRIRGAWQGRISGCQLGKPVELLSMREGPEALQEYLTRAQALPLRDYVPLVPGTIVEELGAASCKENLTRSEPDDDIHYSVLALTMLEEHGARLQTVHVARAWLRMLPAGQTFTAERAAYRILLDAVNDFAPDVPRDFDLARCSDNPYSDWIGAQIRADVYGWVCPGRPALAARLARADAELSHREDGVYGAVFVAALGAAIPACATFGEAIDLALAEIPADSGAAEAVALGRSLVGKPDAAEQMRARYSGLSPVHTLNNLTLVVWALLSGEDDFSAAIGEAVAAGWDTDCNGATVGGLWGISGRPIPESWTAPWQGRVGLALAGHSEVSLDELVARTVQVARDLTECR